MDSIGGAKIIRFPTAPWARSRSTAPASYAGEEAHDADGQPMGMTWEEIGEALGVSPQRAQQIAASGLAKLQRVCERIRLGIEDVV